MNFLYKNASFHFRIRHDRVHTKSRYVYLRLVDLKVDLTGPNVGLVQTNSTREVDQTEINIPT